MTELETYRPPVDSWTLVLADVGDLAGKLASTDFVPKTMQGKPAAIAAAILTGRELGVPPMTALAHIHVIQGKPGLSAQLMRSLILSSGHHLRYVETTTTRCVVEGRRNGEEDWQRVQFTADDAKKAGINLGNYPEDKLVARATSRIARRVFPDAIGGMAYTPEELEDGVVEVDTATGEITSGRTAKRANATAKAKATRGQPVTVDMPPLVVDAPPLDDVETVAAENKAEELDGEVEGVTKPQLAKIHALFGDIGWTDRDDRLRAASTIIGRVLASSSELSKAEASTLIDELESISATDDPSDSLTNLIASVA